MEKRTRTRTIPFCEFSYEIDKPPSNFPNLPNRKTRDEIAETDSFNSERASCGNFTAPHCPYVWQEETCGGKHIRKAFHKALLAALLSSFGAASVIAQRAVGYDPYVTFAGNFDVGYHETQFFEPHHNTAVGQWDTRCEIWLPPFRKKFSWGPYLRVTGIGASETQAWENGWLGGPGVGFQFYPFSSQAFRQRNKVLASIVGPLRVFGEYNRLDYWGKQNTWRPRHETRFGGEYWRARHVNDTGTFWWTEIWTGAWWQSANEFAPHYNTGIFANALRAGVRVPNARLLSVFTPYGALESSLTDNKTYYWENKLVAGGGLRLAPNLEKRAGGNLWIDRFAVYGEYVHVAAYYRLNAPATIPDHDVRVGITFSVGQWYR